MATVVQIRIVGSDESKAALTSVRQGLAGVGDASDSTSGRLRGMLGSLTSIASTAVLGGIAGIGVGLLAAAGSGLSFNKSIEDVTAQLNAFTKDGVKTAEILEMIKARASATPFAFEEMATAAASLMPAANASGVALEELIKQAEILAASNPAQGLDGAAIALKEAVGGDFVSIIERFNLPRQRLNELKEQGVPAIEAVQIAMRELGLDSDLVSNLAETAGGRWSTFKDTMQGVFATITQPVFDTLSSSLGSINALLVANEPAIKAFADSLAVGVGSAIQTVVGYAGQLSTTWASVQAALASDSVSGPLTQIGSIFQQVAALATSAMNAIVQGVQSSGPQIQVAFNAFSSIVGTLQGVFNTVLSVVSTVLTQVKLFIDQNGTQIVQTFMTTWSTVQATVANYVAALAAVINPVLQQIQTFVNAHGTEIRTFLATTWQQINTAIQLAMQLINATVVPALKAIGAFIAAHGTEIQTILSNAWTVASTIISTALNTIIGVFKIALQLINGDWSGAWATIQETCATIVQAIITVIRATLETVDTIFDGALSDASDTVRGFISNFTTVGGDLIRGMISGVTSAAGQLASAAADAAYEALEAAKNALGIKSPSRVAAAEVGKPFVQGIVQGIRESFGLLSKISGDLGKQLTKDMEKAAAGATAAFRAVFIAGLQGRVDVDSTKLANIGNTDELTSTNKDTVQRQLEANYEKLSNARKAQVDKAKALDEQENQAAADRASKITAVQASRTEKMADARKSRDEKLADAASDKTKKLADVDAGSGSEAEKADKRAKIELDYREKVAGYAKDYADKAADSNADAAKRIEAINADAAKKAADFAKIRLEATAAAAKAVAELEKEQARLHSQSQIAAKVDADNQRVAMQAREALSQAEAEAAAMQQRTGDAALSARFYQMRSQQILQLANLQKEINDAAYEGDSGQVALLTEQYAQAQKLQQSQIDLFEATKGDKTPLSGLLRDLEAMRDSFVDTEGRIIDNAERASVQALIDNLKAQAADQGSSSTVSSAGPNTPGNVSTVNNYNLTISSSASTENVVADFHMMQAMNART